MQAALQLALGQTVSEVDVQATSGDCPPGQVVHVVQPAAPAAEKEPAAHEVQVLAPKSAYVPAAHCASGAPPPGHDDPAGHHAQLPPLT